MKSSYLRHAVSMIATAGLVSVSPVVQGDEVATVLQYELGLGGSKSVSTFYLGFQSVDLDHSKSFAGGGSSLRIPLYSTDPSMRTTFSQFSAADAENNGTNKVSDALVGLVGVVFYIGLPVYATVKQLEEIGKFEIDIPEFQPPPEAPASPAANTPSKE